MPFLASLRLLLLLPALLLFIGCDGEGEMMPDPPDEPGAWALVQSVNEPRERHEHAYVAVGDTFYLLGGRGQRPVEAYDPDAKTWQAFSNPPFQMHHFQAVSYQGKIYIMGAFTGGFPDETPIPNIYIYDPASDTWIEGPEIPADRRRGAAGAVVHNNQFYIVSGIQNGHTDGHVTWMDRYDPATDTWTQLADAPRARDHFHAVVLDGKIYAAAGRRSSFATGETANLTEAKVDVYDIASDTWTTLSADLPTERAGTAAVAFDGQVVVIGGESVRRLPSDGDTGPPTAHNEVEAYHPGTGAWTAMPTLNVGRHGAQAIAHDGHIYITAGSRTLGGNEINSQEVYEP